MKKVQALLLVLIPATLLAQKKDTLDVSDLYTPASAGFTLMDKAPSSVEKPTTTKAFEADILNLAEGAAIQVTPFWLKNHDNLKAEDYTRHTTPFFETLNFSVSTVKSDSNYSIGLGFRTQLVRIFSFKGKTSLQGKLDSIQTLLGDFSAALGRGDTAAQRSDTTRINKIYKDYRRLITRPVFVAEVAGAALAVTPSSPFSNSTLSKLNKSGIWLNIRYSPFKLPLDFVGVCRYTIAGVKARLSARDSAFADYGLGVFYENSRICLSAEYLNRYDVSRQKSYDRLAAAINYKLSSQIVVVGSFGKNYDNIENVFTTLGVNFGLSKNTVRVAKQPIAN